MKLTIKNLKQVPHEVEVPDESVTVLDLKKAVEQSHGFDHTSLKLLYNGAVLNDASKLSDYNIKEGNVLIMMNTKAKPVNVPKTEPTQTTSTTADVKQIPTTTQTTTQPTTTQPKPEKDYSAGTKTLMEMGFPKPESEAAIKAARGNLDLAVEFLYNGIPENLPSEEELSGESSGNELKNIASIVKIIVSQNPSALQNILLGIQQNDPALMELIKNNEEEFKNLLQQPVTDEDLRNFQNFQNQTRQVQEGLGGRSGEQRGSGQPNVRGNTIALSKQDYDAVNRLKELGFNEMDSVQAYFACDKNEDMAANLLWENKLKEQEQELYIDCKYNL